MDDNIKYVKVDSIEDMIKEVVDFYTDSIIATKKPKNDDPTLDTMRYSCMNPTPTRTYDDIEHPAHYCEGRKYEPWDVIKDWELDYDLGCAVKYISRAGRKDGATKLKDLNKAKQYIQHEIDSLEDECDCDD